MVGMNNVDTVQGGGLPIGRILLIVMFFAVALFSIGHALESHSDSASWVAKEAARNDPCWTGTDSTGRQVTVGKFNQNGDDKFGLCFDDPGPDGEMEYVTSYPTRKSILGEIIDALTGRGFQ